MNISKHWFKYWLAAWRHQAITWSNVDLSSVGSCAIHPMAIALEMTAAHLKFTHLKLKAHPPGNNELKNLKIQFITSWDDESSAQYWEHNSRHPTCIVKGIIKIQTPEALLRAQTSAMTSLGSVKQSSQVWNKWDKADQKMEKNLGSRWWSRTCPQFYQLFLVSCLAYPKIFMKTYF